ncbi:hypothetical protein FN976_26710 [Caenimonas sedimenti]|uniref:Uncharacterized protein n=1 Tax=Caenimonas sedimenti TaxID=2596921 RepID=A0A562ZFX0_9BURK|nr:hypothetical protein FN976_26710 [Caenimonas sedimenti]
MCTPPATSAPVRLDDSASPRYRVGAQVVLAENGRRLAEMPLAKTAEVRFGRVDYKLATAAYLGRKARIFYVVPANVPGLRAAQGLRADWRGLGRFAGGSAFAGQRQLVWNGTISEPWMVESIELTAHVDLQQVRWARDGHFAFEAYFEIEVLP